MTLRLGIGMILGLSLMYPRCLQGERRSHMVLLICDQVGIDAENRLAAKTQTIRILNDAGIDIAWTNADRASELCEIRSTSSYFTVLILARPPEHWAGSDTIGMAPGRTGLYPRAYIFYDAVK